MWIFYTFGEDYKIITMDWLVFPLAKMMYWFFQNVLENLENLPNYAFCIFAVVAFTYWVKWQMKYNAEAKANPDQIK